MTETTRHSKAVATLTLNTEGMGFRERSRLAIWLLGKAWVASTGPKTFSYDPKEWYE